MIVEYIQPICPYCSKGLYINEDQYFCSSHGNIEKGLVQYIPCEKEGDKIKLPAFYEVTV